MSDQGPGPGSPFGPGDLPPGFDEEQLRKMAEEFEARTTVQQVLEQTIQLLGTLVESRIRGAHRDAAQARLGIDALKALQGVLEPSLPAHVASALAQSIANLQMLYVSAPPTGAVAPAPGPAPAQEPAAQPAPDPAPAAEEA